MKSAIIFLAFTLVLFMADPAELQPLQPQGNQVSGKLELSHYGKTRITQSRSKLRPWKIKLSKHETFTELYYPFVVCSVTLYITNEKKKNRNKDSVIGRYRVVPSRLRPRVERCVFSSTKKKTVPLLPTLFSSSKQCEMWMSLVFGKKNYILLKWGKTRGSVLI